MDQKDWGEDLAVLYWGLEYTKVLLGYVFIMFVWPSVIFRNYLKGKSRTFHFSFCVTVQIVLANTVVLMLGLFHILYPWVFGVVFYGSFFLSLAGSIKIGEKERRHFKYLITGTYGVKHFINNVLDSIRRKAQKIFGDFCRRMRSHWWEYGLLGVLVVFGMIYFSYGAFQDYSFGFGDMYVHNAWTYELVQGNIFSAGVYPEAMHCFLYALHVLFGIRIYSCLLFLPGVHIAVYLVSAYIFLKEIFRWHYTPVFVLAMFLTIDLVCIDEVYSMSRLQWALPQEFGLFTVFLCTAFFVRYLRSRKRVERKGKVSRGYWDGNLLVFALALACSLAIHFYATMMAFFVCICFVPVVLRKVFRRGYFLPLVAAVLGGFLIAVVPMGGALASGIPFQGSIGWAMNVINGTAGESVAARQLGTTGQNAAQGNEGTAGQDAAQGQEGAAGQDDAAQGGGQTVGQDTASTRESFAARVGKLWGRIVGILQRLSDGMWRFGYVTLYKEERAGWIVGFTFLAALIWALGRLGIMLKRGIFKRETFPAEYFDGYFSVTLASILLILVYSMPYLGFPELIAGSRLCSTGQMLILAVMAVPVDLIFTLVRLVICEGILKAVSACCVAGIYAGTMLTGTFHGYLYFELTRYNGAVMSTITITDSLPKGTYTIVSPVDELYQMIQYGWHEELVNFVNESMEAEYRLPTEYVFIYLEKKPIQYGQSHFFTGPGWLAWEKYPEYYTSFVSQCPDITCTEITEESIASTYGRKYNIASSSYSNLTVRTLVESKAYVWCEEFRELYPNELKVYYEDEYFVCYYFKQNVQNFYQLGILPGGAE